MTKRLVKKKKKKSSLKGYIPHIIFALLFAAIVVSAFVVVIRWNKGVSSGYDPNEVSTEFETETEDFYVARSEAQVRQHESDDVLTVLLLGNGAIAGNRGNDGIASFIRESTGGVVYDCSLDRTYLCTKNQIYDPEYMTDALSFYWMAHALAKRDFTVPDSVKNDWVADDKVKDILEMYEMIDMSTVDEIVIMYDYHDYRDERELETVMDRDLAISFKGALMQGIKLLSEAYPHARITVSSPYYCHVEYRDKLYPCDEKDFGYGVLADYVVAEKAACAELGISFIDNYFGSITADNWQQYLDEDKSHLNEEGRKLIAERIVGFIHD